MKLFLYVFIGNVKYQKCIMGFLKCQLKYVETVIK